jgi:hypothetical protein
MGQFPGRAKMVFLFFPERSIYHTPPLPGCDVTIPSPSDVSFKVVSIVADFRGQESEAGPRGCKIGGSDFSFAKNFNIVEGILIM